MDLYPVKIDFIGINLQDWVQFYIFEIGLRSFMSDHIARRSGAFSHDIFFGLFSNPEMESKKIESVAPLPRLVFSCGNCMANSE